MKKIAALLITAALVAPLTPASHGQTPGPEKNGGFLSGIAQLATLENYETQEGIEGEMEFDEFDFNMKVNYKFDLQSQIDTSKLSTRAKVSGIIQVNNDSPKSEFGPNFQFMSLKMEGEVLQIEDDIYFKLDELSNTQLRGADTQFREEINGFLVGAKLIEGNWYQLSTEPETARMDSPAQLKFLGEFRSNPKMALENWVLKMVETQAKTEQFYNDLYGDYVDPFSVDYKTYLEDDSVKKTKIDKDALEGKGILMCNYYDDPMPFFEDGTEVITEPGLIDDPETVEDDGTMVEMMTEVPTMQKPESFENGLQKMYCYPNYEYTETLTDEEQNAVDAITASYGEWLYVDGTWYLAEVYPTYPSYEEELALMESFDYDMAAIEERLSKTRSGLSLFFGTQFFKELEMKHGPRAGYQFFSLNRNAASNFIEQLASLMGEKLSSGDLRDMQSELSKMKLAGVYHLSQNGKATGALNDFSVRFKYGNEDFLTNFVLQYSLKLTNPEANNKIEAPQDTVELDSLMEMLSEL